MDYTEYARLFKALSDPKRLKIVHMLAGGELCACKILEEFHITQPTLSHDMKLLTAAGLVIPRREGKWTHYSLNKTRVGEICRAAESRGKVSGFGISLIWCFQIWGFEWQRRTDVMNYIVKRSLLWVCRYPH